MKILSAIPLIVMFVMVVITSAKASALHRSSGDQGSFYFFWLKLNDTAMRPIDMTEVFPACDTRQLRSYRMVMLMFFVAFMSSIVSLMAISIARS